MGYRKVILILAIVVAASVMLGCSGSTTSDDDKATPTVTPSSTPVTTPTQQPQAGTSKSNPAPVGTAVAVSSDTGLVPYSAKVTLLEYESGQTAYDTLKSWDNVLLDAPDEGKEYHIIKVKFELISTENDASYYLNPLSFDAVAGGNVYTADLLAVPTSNGLGNNMYPDASKEGWVAYQLPTGSSSVLISFDRNLFDGSVKAWLSTA
jgi:Telomeric repeat-binding factor 2.